MVKKVKKLNILKKLRSSGLRPTKQRVEIARFLFDREKTLHFTVESLNKLLTKKNSMKFALATIYNSVHAFKEAGHLNELEVSGKKKFRRDIETKIHKVSFEKIKKILKNKHPKLKIS